MNVSSSLRGILRDTGAIKIKKICVEKDRLKILNKTVSKLILRFTGINLVRNM